MIIIVQVLYLFGFKVRKQDIGLGEDADKGTDLMGHGKCLHEKIPAAWQPF